MLLFHLRTCVQMKVSNDYLLQDLEKKKAYNLQYTVKILLQ